MDFEVTATWLSAHAPHDDEEGGYLTQMITLLDQDAPFSRGTFAPGHFTASAFVLHPVDDALLLIFHGKLKRWLQPGGHIELDDETLLHAARREAAEEAGTEALALVGDDAAPIFDVDVHEIPARKDEPAHLHHDVRFLFRAQSDALIVGDGVEGSRWVPLDEVSLAESDRSVMRAVEKLRA